MTCHSSGRSPTMAIGLGPLLTPSRMRIPSPPQNRTTFMACPHSDDLERGDREYQPAAPRPDVFQLRADLVPEVPRQHENVVGAGLSEPPRRVDRDARTRQVLALLHRTPVDRIRKQVRPDAAVVQQRVPLARGTVACDGLALPGGSEKETGQVSLDLQNFPVKAFMAGNCVQARSVFGIEHVLDLAAWLSRGAQRLCVNTERAAMRVELLDVDYPEAGGSQRAGRRQQGQVGEVLVVDRVVLTSLDQPQQVRELQCDESGVADQRAEAGGETPDVRYMREHVVGDDQICLAEFPGELRTSVRPEELHLGPDAARTGGFCDVSGWLDAKDADSRGGKVLKKVSVVTRNLGNQAAGIQVEAIDHRVRIALGMRDP